MDPTLQVSAGLWERLVGPYGALALALAMIVLLWRDRTISQRRNDELSACLVQVIESNSRERVKMIDDFALRLDSTVRMLLENFTWLSNVRRLSGKSSSKPPELEGKKTPQPG